MHTTHPATLRGYRPPLRLFTFILALILTGCTSIRLISDYDEVIDKGATELQRSVETFLVALEKNDRPAMVKLSSHEEAFFDKMNVDISSLKVRASAQPKNAITTQMLSNVQEQISTIRELLNEGYKKEHIKLIRDSINSSLGAVIKFELAKKRGESTKESNK